MCEPFGDHLKLWIKTLLVSQCVDVCGSVPLGWKQQFLISFSLSVVFFDIKKYTDYYQLSGSVKFVKSLLLDFFFFF